MRLVVIGSMLALAAGSAAADPLSHYGIGVTLGGGVEGFTNSRMAETAGTGPAWGLRVQLGTRTPVSLEAAYDGSAQTVDAFGLDNRALLVGTGIEAGARFNAWPRAVVSPYLSMGLGFRRYDLTRFDANFSDVNDNDHVLELPLGAGVAVRFAGLVLDARVQFRAATGAGLISDDSNTAHLPMHRWGISGNLGYEF